MHVWSGWDSGITFWQKRIHTCGFFFFICSIISQIQTENVHKYMWMEMHLLSWMQIYNRNCQSALYQRVLQISVTADTRKDEWKRGGGRFWLLKRISNHVIMYLAAVTFFWSSVEDGVLISVILSSSLSKDIAVSPSWFLRGCVPVYSQFTTWDEKPQVVRQ